MRLLLNHIQPDLAQDKDKLFRNQHDTACSFVVIQFQAQLAKEKNNIVTAQFAQIYTIKLAATEYSITNNNRKPHRFNAKTHIYTIMSRKWQTYFQINC